MLFRNSHQSPYDDAIVITSQIMAIFALLFSLAWWVTFEMSIIGMVLIQLLWCCRQNKHSIYASTAVAFVNSLVSLGFRIYCISHYWWYDNAWYYARYSCLLLCGILWFAVAACMFWFVKSGRHAKWEANYSRSTAEINDDADLMSSNSKVRRPQSPRRSKQRPKWIPQIRPV